MRQRRPTPRRREAPRWTAEEWAMATQTLLRRSGHLCEWCGHVLIDCAERHHRMRRRDGGDRLSNLLLLHPECHAYITGHPAEARERGAIVSALAGVPPGDVPVTIGGRVWLLDDWGTRQPV